MSLPIDPGTKAELIARARAGDAEARAALNAKRPQRPRVWPAVWCDLCGLVTEEFCHKSICRLGKGQVGA